MFWIMRWGFRSSEHVPDPYLRCAVYCCLTLFPALSLAQTRGRRRGTCACRNWGSRETSELRRIGPAWGRWWWRKSRSRPMAPPSARSPRATASPNQVLDFISIYYSWLKVSSSITTYYRAFQCLESPHVCRIYSGLHYRYSGLFYTDRCLLSEL